MYLVMYDKVILIFLLFMTSTTCYEVSVTIRQGEIVGTREMTVFGRRLYYSFYGVPYAKPPIGKSRFTDPRPQKEWLFPLDGFTEYKGTCAQAHIVHKHGLYGNEDCLNMNIYTPQLPKEGDDIIRSVIVWFHGYAFTSTFSHIYGPDLMIDNDVIFISVSYRISVFGFLKMNETDTNSNMGLKDMVRALKWIRKNIRKFGGNKKNLTVMGNSSAATFLSLLLTTKHKKLFSKMILHSGGMFSPSLFSGDRQIEKDRLKVALKRIVDKDLTKAKALDIITAASKIYTGKDLMNAQRPLIPFAPGIEHESKKSLLTKTPEDFFDGLGDDGLSIPILIGFNTQESLSEVIPFVHNPHYLKSFSSFFKYFVPFMKGCQYNYTTQIYHEIGNKIKHNYFRDGIDERSVDNFLRYSTDLHIYPIYKFIKTLLKFNKKKTFVYKFNYSGQFNAVKGTATSGGEVKVKGAANGDELCYLLRCEPLWGLYKKYMNNTNHKDVKFMKNISKFWANFAKSGNPTPSIHKGDISWPPMTISQDILLLLQTDMKLSDSKKEQKMFEFWNQIYDAYYSPERCSTTTSRDEL